MERILPVNGIALCVETFGDPANPALLLLRGAAESMDFWEVEFCTRLAGPRFVIRYDTRDTGRSVSYPPGEPGYDMPDLVDDAVGVLDALGVARAHLVGLSMGGGLVQRLALDHADRVASITLVSTTPGGPGGAPNTDLPPMLKKLEAVFAADAPRQNWSDRAVALDQLIEGEKIFGGTLPYDEEARRALNGQMIDRTVNLESAMTNHWLLGGGEPVRQRLGQIDVPTLVLHGTEDPLFPPDHGKALAREIPGARLVLLEGAGHELPKPVWDVAIPQILAISRPR